MAGFLTLPIQNNPTDPDFYVTGDAFPPLILTLTDDQDPAQPIDLTGARVRMGWENKATGQTMLILDSDDNQITVVDNVITVLQFDNNLPSGKYNIQIQINRAGSDFSPILGVATIRGGFLP